MQNVAAFGTDGCYVPHLAADPSGLGFVCQLCRARPIFKRYLRSCSKDLGNGQQWPEDEERNFKKTQVLPTERIYVRVILTVAIYIEI
jgi:hypothetical protein